MVAGNLKSRYKILRRKKVLLSFDSASPLKNQSPDESSRKKKKRSSHSCPQWKKVKRGRSTSVQHLQLRKSINIKLTAKAYHGKLTLHKIPKREGNLADILQSKCQHTIILISWSPWYLKCTFIICYAKWEAMPFVDFRCFKPYFLTSLFLTFSFTRSVSGSTHFKK